MIAAHPHVALTGESPVWDDERNCFWWIDIQGQWLLGWDPDSGRASSTPLQSQPGLVALSDGGDLVVGLEDGLWLHAPESNSWALLCAVEANDPRTRINDGKPDHHGRLWFGTMEKFGSGDPIGGLYCWSQATGLTRVRDNVGIPNAICFSADGHRMFFADSPSRKLESWEISPDSIAMRDGKVFAIWPENEKPDGACVDSEGNIWIAIVGGSRLDCIAPDGTGRPAVALPVSRPTMPAFGGSDGGTLVVTSQRRFLDFGALSSEPYAGGLYAAKAPTRAAPSLRCRLE